MDHNCNNSIFKKKVCFSIYYKTLSHKQNKIYVKCEKYKPFFKKNNYLGIINLQRGNKQIIDNELNESIKILKTKKGSVGLMRYLLIPSSISHCQSDPTD